MMGEWRGSLFPSPPSSYPQLNSESLFCVILSLLNHLDPIAPSVTAHSAITPSGRCITWGPCPGARRGALPVASALLDHRTSVLLFVPTQDLELGQE